MTAVNAPARPAPEPFAATLAAHALRAETIRGDAARIKAGDFFDFDHASDVVNSEDDLRADALRWIATHGDSQSAALAATALNTRPTQETP